MKLFTAIDGKGNSLVTVIADGQTDARVQAYEEMNKNASRQALLKRWIKYGCKLEAQSRGKKIKIKPSRGQTNHFECMECGSKFYRKIGKYQVYMECPNCSSYDTELI